MLKSFLNLQNQNNQNNIVLIDGSYFVFYRYYAIHSWLKFKKSSIDDLNIILNDPFNNKMFLNSFEKQCNESLNKIIKKFKPTPSNSNFKLIVCKDCAQSSIWRFNFIDNYKSERKEELHIHLFFEYFYNTILKNRTDIIVVEHNHLEADDCIALITKHIQTNIQTNIIANDNDYLQLLMNDKIQLYDLKLNNISYKNLDKINKIFATSSASINQNYSLKCENE